MGYLATHLKQLSDKRLEQARHPEFEGDSLSPAVDELLVIRRLARALDPNPTDEIPDAVRTATEQSLAQITSLLEQMISLTMLQQNWHQTRASLARDVHNHYETWRNQHRQHIRGDVSALTKVADLDEQARTLRELQAQVADTTRDAEVLLDKVQRLAGEVGAGELSKHYREQADDHGGAATLFLWVSGGLALLLAVLSWVLFQDIETGRQWPDFAREALARLFFLGIVGYALTFAVRGYRANTHLRVVNQQKANALDTFILFQASATSEVGKEAITLELVRAVFSQADSGFLDGGRDRTIIEEQGAPMMGLLAARMNSGKP